MWNPQPSGPPNDFPGPIDHKPQSLDEGSQIQQAYQQFLGRPASPEEIQNWLSGIYGHGRSGNLIPIFEAIRQSGEAQPRPPMSGPRPPLPMPMPGPMPKPLPKPGGPMSNPQIAQMRKAILGVPEY